MALDQLPSRSHLLSTIVLFVVRSFTRGRNSSHPLPPFSFRHFIFRSAGTFATFRFDPFSISSHGSNIGIVYVTKRATVEGMDFHFRFKLLCQYFSIFVYSDEGNLVRRRYLFPRMSKFFPLSEFQSRGSERTRSTPLRNCKIPSYLTRGSCPRGYI